LRTTLVQAAHAAARTRGTYLSAQYRRLAARRGKKRAILAVAHSMLVMADYMIQRREPYRDAGAAFLIACSRKTPRGASSNGWKPWAIT
jgi:transposase